MQGTFFSIKEGNEIKKNRETIRGEWKDLKIKIALIFLMKEVRNKNALMRDE